MPKQILRYIYSYATHKYLLALPVLEPIASSKRGQSNVVIDTDWRPTSRGLHRLGWLTFFEQLRIQPQYRYASLYTTYFLAWHIHSDLYTIPAIIVPTLLVRVNILVMYLQRRGRAVRAKLMSTIPLLVKLPFAVQPVSTPNLLETSICNLPCKLEDHKECIQI